LARQHFVNVFSEVDMGTNMTLCNWLSMPQAQGC